MAATTTTPPRAQLWRDAALVGLVALCVAVVFNQVWAGSLTVPFTYNRDAALHLALFQNQLDAGTWLRGPRIGAPFGGDMSDFPLGGERISWVISWLLVHLTRRPALTSNLMILLSYPAVASVGYLGARKLGLSRASAWVVALAFAFLPYHQGRARAHLLRVFYVAVPLAVAWILRGLDERAWTRPEIRALVLVGVFVACCDTQHAMFFCALFGLGALVTAARRRSWQPLALTLALVAASAGTLVVNNAPYVRARIERGANERVAKRKVDEQERYGLRIATLILPPSGHRIPALAKLKSRARTETLARSEDGQSLGLLGSVGLIGLLLTGLGRAAFGARKPAVEGEEPAESGALAGRLGVVAIVAMLVATGSGFAYVLSLLGLTQLRTWNRISLFIAWAALIGLGLLLDRLWPRLRARFDARGGLLVAACVVALVSLSLFDTLSPKRVPPHADNAAAWAADRWFYVRVEHGLGSGCEVAQWPYQRFPEPPDLRAMPAYDHLKAVLHTRTARFSYGSMTGRPEGDWARDLDDLPPRTAVAILAAVGFEGLIVDRAGYASAEVEALEGSFRGLVGGPILEDQAGRRALYDLRALQTKLANDGLAPLEPEALSRLVTPVELRWGRTFFQEERRGGNRWRWSRERGHLRLELVGDAAPRDVVVYAKISSRDATPGVLVVDTPAGSERFELREGEAWLELAVHVPEDGADLWLRWEGEVASPANADGRALVFRVINPLIHEDPRTRALDCWTRRVDGRREACAEPEADSR